MSQKLNEIGLGELISKVKEELASTNKDNPVFIVESVELELQVAVSKEQEVKVEGKAKADLKINVLSFDFFKLGEAEGTVSGSTKTNNETIHTIRITLTPAILNDDLMAKLTPDSRKKVEKNTELIFQSSHQVSPYDNIDENK
ncbi:trypco2 family protein [Anabaena sp. UHCC 0451]|uniref:trypco2 family protein n=1 Tax=Anabaena sp. UHCC 0451 TaxID=2055235 RepID=UPI002B1E9A3A|nr:trypco2 family protein [Anabaena sp. UHCC 0451]MEA5574937.1 trypco2 family protein [Anabaena sp. UHCC 0451]